MKKNFLAFFLFFLILFLLPLTAQAICEGPIVTCGYDIDGNGQVEIEEGCNLCHFFEILSNIFELILTCFLPIIGGAMFVLGGMYIVLSGISPSQLNQGKTVLKATLIGIVIILAAWVGLNTIFTKIGMADWTGLGTWWEFDCVAGFEPPPPPPIPVCGVCQEEDGVGGCRNLPDTKWGDNLHRCEGNNPSQYGMPANHNKRCVDGVCRTCTGLLYNDGCGGCTFQGNAPDYLACWYYSSYCCGFIPQNSCDKKCQGHGSSCVTAAPWNDTRDFAAHLYCPICKSPMLGSRQRYQCNTSSGSEFPGVAGSTCYVRSSGNPSCSATRYMYGRFCVCKW